ncbi:hypothetical protein GALL_384690 [mine drainage metagenome]|uniref:Uncharacterized protein n=1 Tax=mine drainage metagenome TaxID=410659 RepID=A0A1J5QQN0_9ZZZZ
MRAAGCQTQHHITFGNGRAVDDSVLFHHADGKTCQVIFAGRIHTGHFRRFSAHQRAAGLFASGCDAADHLGGRAHFQFAAGEVVEKEQGFCALHQDIVDAHRHQVDADRVVLVELERQLELGADAVGTGYHDRIFEFLRHFEQRTETADAGQHLGAHGTAGIRLDVFDQRVASFDIHACVAVADG